MSEHTVHLVHSEGPNAAEIISSWNYAARTKFELRDVGASDWDSALVDNELVYTYKEGQWHFDLKGTAVLAKLMLKEGVELTGNDLDPVAGIEFSSKPRDEWTMGNWIAHVGGGIRSDHCVVFGSVMAVDAMIKQIFTSIKKSDHLKREAGPLTVKLTGGTQYQRFVVAMDVAGGLNNMNVTSGPGLAETIALENGKGGLTFEKAAVVMAAIEVSGGIKVDIELSPGDEDNG